MTPAPSEAKTPHGAPDLAGIGEPRQRHHVEDLLDHPVGMSRRDRG
ncbi:MAG: hypothetical protein R6V26_02110 [Roseovarius sp.]